MASDKDNEPMPPQPPSHVDVRSKGLANRKTITVLCYCGNAMVSCANISDEIEANW